MVQQLLAYFLLALASFYVLYRAYENLKKKKACGKCELMKTANAPKKATN